MSTNYYRPNDTHCSLVRQYKKNWSANKQYLYSSKEGRTCITYFFLGGTELLRQVSILILKWNDRITPIPTLGLEVQTKFHLGTLKTSRHTNKNFTGISPKIRNNTWKSIHKHYFGTLRTSKYFTAIPGKLLQKNVTDKRVIVHEF